MWVTIHMCMKAVLVISLYIGVFSQTRKTLYLSNYLLCFLFDKIREEEGGTCSAQKQGWGGHEEGGSVPNYVYTCK
jgi:hypothetical protein